MSIGTARAATIFCGLLILSGCDQTPGKITGKPYEVKNVIKEVSFYGAHEDHHCSKGCRYVFVPDRWYLQFCNMEKSADCFTRRIEHAPWKWQQEGSSVTAVWQPHENYDTLEKIFITATGEEVRL